MSYIQLLKYYVILCSCVYAFMYRLVTQPQNILSFRGRTGIIESDF